MTDTEAARAQGAEAVVERIRSIAEGWERDARLYPDARIGFAAIAYILRTALEPVDGTPPAPPASPARTPHQGAAVNTDAAPQSWPCAVCLRPSTPRVHPGCEDRIRTNLQALPGLYVQLADALHPGRRGGDGRTGTRSAPLPCNLDVLDLRARGGIEGIVGGWARDLCEREGWTLPEYGTVEAAIEGYAGLLLINLPMICDEHPAVKEIADELRQVVGQARRFITGEKPPIRIPVACECGHILKVTLDMDGIRCPHCQEQYDHSRMLNLTPTRRAAA